MIGLIVDYIVADEVLRGMAKAYRRSKTRRCPEGWGLRTDVALENPGDGYRRCKAVKLLNLSGKRTE